MILFRVEFFRGEESLCFGWYATSDEANADAAVKLAENGWSFNGPEEIEVPATGNPVAMANFLGRYAGHGDHEVE